MLDGDKARLIGRTISEYDELYKRSKGSFSVRENVLLDVFLYMFLIMNICCIVILNNHSSSFIPVFSGKLGLFSKGVPLCFSIALIAIVPITILFLVLLYRKYKVQSVKHNLVDKGVVFAKHLADYVRDLDINSRRIESVIASLHRELDILITKQNELSEICERRVEGFDRQFRQLTEDTKIAITGLATRFANNDGQIQELSSRLQKLCVDSKTSAKAISDYVAGISDVAKRQLERCNDQVALFKRLYNHLTAETSSVEKVQGMIKKCVDYVESKPHLKKSKRFLCNSKVWNICCSLKDLLPKGEQEDTSEESILNWAQGIVKVLDKYKFSECSEEDLSPCKDDGERNFVRSTLLIDLPMMQIDALRLIVNVRQDIFKKACTAAQGFAENIISDTCFSGDSVAGSSRSVSTVAENIVSDTGLLGDSVAMSSKSMSTVSLHTADTDGNPPSEADDDYLSSEVIVEHMTSKTHKPRPAPS
ncbi:hypothetical protein EHRUM4_01220 [Ehrlichia ruminantium]|uniref:hypothetical protein n=1 Tax=Ehrlichia ruminantium TaxID=779 RepID=UPI0007C10591|nr:hypothetical protein [Ehrlichia ruminantium]GAT79124.1 hypothetical protein EHRUM4_01220 [Ehrlichia ruminantium]